jgi:hypothetical protein
MCFIGLIFSVEAQQTPYQSINQKLGSNAIQPKQLWPFEIDGFAVNDLTVDYKFPFQETDSDLKFSFSNFKLFKSTVYDLNSVDPAILLEGYYLGIDEKYTEDFKKISNQRFCLMASKEVDGEVREVYLLVGDQKIAELLYFVYSDSSSSLHSKLKIELNKTKY